MYRLDRHAAVAGSELRRFRSFTTRGAQLGPFDGSRLLTIYLALLILIPSNLAIGALGAAGSPANIFGVILFGRWLVARTQRTTPRGWNFLRVALAFYALAIVLSYLFANLRPLTDLEVNGGDRGLIRLISWSGVALVAMDGLPTRAAFRRVLEVAAGGGVVLGLLGLMQATTNINPADHIHIPGLRPLSLDKLASPELRNGLPRVYATTSHPIEFATVLVLMIALTIPLALRENPDKRSRWWLAGLAVMGITFPLAVARSGFLAAAALGAVIIPRLPPRTRRRTLIALPLGLAAVHTSFPGLLGTIKTLFFAVGDGSEYARTSDYPVVAEYFREKPLFGRGFGTLISEIYRVLDNEYLLTLVEAGLVGLLAYFTLHIAMISTARRTRKAATNANDRLTAQAFVGVAAASLASAGTFDALSFPMFAGMFFFCIGLCGGFSRLIAAETAPTTPAAAKPAPPRLTGLRRAAVIATCVIVAAVGVHWIKSTPRTWVTTASTVVAPADTPQETRFAGALSTPLLADIVRQIMLSDEVRDGLAAKGYRASYTIALESGSLEFGTDVLDSGPLIQVEVQSHDPVNTEATARALMQEMNTRLHSLQEAGGVDPSVRGVLSQTFVAATPVPEKSGGKRAYAALLGLVVVLYFALQAAVRRIPYRRRTPPPRAHRPEEIRSPGSRLVGSRRG